MSTPERLKLCAVLMLVGMGTAAVAAEGPGLGVPASRAAVAARDISIAPDGAGLPAGSGTAIVGEKLYLARCLACHGEKGQDGLHDRLVGGHGSLTTKTPVKTVGSYWPYATTLFDYIRRAMPYQEPRSLQDGEVYALTAYLLYLNGIIGQQEVLNANSLPKVKMPNRDNFVWTQEVPGAGTGR
jgi:mono/diheme cytochrome c family protein